MIVCRSHKCEILMIELLYVYFFIRCCFTASHTVRNCIEIEMHGWLQTQHRNFVTKAIPSDKIMHKHHFFLYRSLSPSSSVDTKVDADGWDKSDLMQFFKNNFANTFFVAFHPPRLSFNHLSLFLPLVFFLHSFVRTRCGHFRKSCLYLFAYGLSFHFATFYHISWNKSQ